jgi:hypothetical protein
MIGPSVHQPAAWPGHRLGHRTAAARRGSRPPSRRWLLHWLAPARWRWWRAQPGRWDRRWPRVVATRAPAGGDDAEVEGGDRRSVRDRHLGAFGGVAGVDSHVEAERTGRVATLVGHHRLTVESTVRRAETSFRDHWTSPTTVGSAGLLAHSCGLLGHSESPLARAASSNVRATCSAFAVAAAPTGFAS